MDRREFLKRGGVLAGAAAGAGGLRWPRPPRRGPGRFESILDGAPADSGVDTVVVAMMENRSFDSYLGWLADDPRYLARGRRRYGPWFHVRGDRSQTYPAPDGTPVATMHHLDRIGDANQWRGCGHPDPGHGWDQGRAERDGGFLALGSGNDEFALGWYDGNDLPLYRELAFRFTVCDRWFCSVLGPTYPNREYLMSGQSGGNKTNYLPFAEGGFQWPNIFDRLAAAGVGAADYYSDLPPALLWGPRMAPYIRPIGRYYEDAAAGTLPPVTFVDPVFTGGNRTDDHPHGDARAAQRFVRDVFAAFARSPQWERGLFVLTYDEWGGFFDHVAPPLFPDDRASDDDQENFGQAGFRVPSILASPRARRGFVDHRRYDHTSVLRFIEWRFLGAPPDGPGQPGDAWFLTTRDRHARNLGWSLDAHRVDPDPGFDLDVPVPDPSPPCADDTTAAGTGPEKHAFEIARDVGFFDAMGFRD